MNSTFRRNSVSFSDEPVASSSSRLSSEEPSSSLAHAVEPEAAVPKSEPTETPEPEHHEPTPEPAAEAVEAPTEVAAPAPEPVHTEEPEEIETTPEPAVEAAPVVPALEISEHE